MQLKIIKKIFFNGSYTVIGKRVRTSAVLLRLNTQKYNLPKPLPAKLLP
jgi:hypothetical protein